MIKSFFRYVLLLILLTLSGAVVLTVGAQSSPTVVINDTQITPEKDALRLNLYVSLQDPSGTLSPETTITEANILLEDGSLFPARLEKSLYYIALVMDASGSMAPVFDEMQQAAIELVNAAPPEVKFAVIEFDDKINLLQPYTNDRNQIIGAINRVQPEDSGTCLYDVAYTAVQSLEQIAQDTPNRAMIIFTDGQDQVQRGTTGACSHYTDEELFTFASNREQNIPIHTVGIAQKESDINEETLSLLSAVTGGTYIDGTAADFSAQLQKALNTLSKQWFVDAAILPNQGIQRGSLLLTLEDGTRLAPGGFVFNSNADYRNPQVPQESAIHISNFRYDELTDSFIFDTSLINLDAAAQLMTEALDAESNIQVEMSLVQNPSVLQQVRFSADNMIAAHRYIVEVVARAGNGKLITSEDGSPVSASYEFRYDPVQPYNFFIDSVFIQNEPARFNFESFKLEDDEGMLVVEYHTTGEEKAAQLNGRLFNKTTNQRTDQFTLESVEPGIAQAALPSENGNYTLVVNALDETGSILTTASHSFTTASPDNTVIRSGKAVRSNPLLLFFFIIMVVVIGFSGWRFGHHLGYRSAYKGLPAGLNLSALSKKDEPEEVKPQLASLTLADSPDKSLIEINRWEITQFPFAIGRDECAITITGDRHVSRKHAQITMENNDYFIEDLASSNGTFVNDTQIAPREPMPLRTDKGTRIQIGKTTSFVFTVETDIETDEEPEAPEAPEDQE